MTLHRWSVRRGGLLLAEQAAADGLRPHPVRLVGPPVGPVTTDDFQPEKV